MRRPEALKARAKRRRDELRKLAETAGRDTFIDSSAPVARYFNATRTLLTQARVYKAEGRTPEAYVLYWRAATFFLERVTKHARYSHASIKALQVSCQRDVSSALQTLEQLDRELLLLYEMEAESDEAAKAASRPGSESQPASTAAVPAGEAAAASVQRVPAGGLVPPQPLLPAVQAAMQAFAREADETRRARAYPTLAEPQQPAPAVLPFAPPFSGLAPRGSYGEPPYASAEQPMPQLAPPPPASLGGSTMLAGFPSAPPPPSAQPAPATPAFIVPPLVPPAVPTPSADARPPPAAPAPPFGFAVPPPLPPTGQPPAGSQRLPSHAPHANCACASPSSHAASVFSPQQGLSARARTVRVPRDLCDRFLEVARPNTLANVETCGVLAGTFVRDELHVTHVLVPAQTGSSDQCGTTAEGEEEVCMYHVTHDLITLGWVHTHPSQMCFFSSVDLHTQCGYQSMLDEAIGIVLAPKSSPSVGIFQLTTPQGLTEVQQCKESGFHPYHQRNGPGAGNGVYCESEHVILAGDMSVQLVDLRKSK